MIGRGEYRTKVVGKGMWREPKVFSLPEEREKALWRLAVRLGVSPTANALTLCKEVLGHRETASSDAEAFGAAIEVVYHLQRGESVQFHYRPALAALGEGPDDKPAGGV